MLSYLLFFSLVLFLCFFLPLLDAATTVEQVVSKFGKIRFNVIPEKQPLLHKLLHSAIQLHERILPQCCLAYRTEGFSSWETILADIVLKLIEQVFSNLCIFYL